uniref:Retrotransposon protein n=1 Tax=Rhabditophanes sp. KR3021 TaxID=114890 RepID=A0AC35UDH1_9BILA
MDSNTNLRATERHSQSEQDQREDAFYRGAICMPYGDNFEEWLADSNAYVIGSKKQTFLIGNEENTEEDKDSEDATDAFYKGKNADI